MLKVKAPEIVEEGRLVGCSGRDILLASKYVESASPHRCRVSVSTCRCSADDLDEGPVTRTCMRGGVHAGVSYLESKTGAKAFLCRKLAHLGSKGIDCRPEDLPRASWCHHPTR